MPDEDEAAALTEGCFWYTEDQVDELITAMMKDMQNDLSSSSHSHDDVKRLLKLIDALLEDDDEEEDGTRRETRKLDNFESVPDRKWHNPIFFKFDGTHSEFVCPCPL